ncbi:ArsR/SmtB family transcription factor [Paenibacillus agaridevorans]|uniref:ArsR/SmtB family transcription factor n=1 Tax=Paenibacillus agaridevorans TaxID=171404 RepID=UPI001BE40FB7|nr:metalloregulator ArsR/SmtB family transcription factor [Paenibacillus agaridevorans]
MYTELADEMKLLSDKTRLMILAMLNEKELCVCDIVSVLDTTQPNVSQHLRKLKAGNLVSEKRKGQWIYYSINSDNKPYVRDILNSLPLIKHNDLEFQTLERC